MFMAFLCPEISNTKFYVDLGPKRYFQVPRDPIIGSMGYGGVKSSGYGLLSR